MGHTYGPLDGSLYATISKKQDSELHHHHQEERQQHQPSREETPVRGPQQDLAGGGVAVIGSPHTVSMDSGISSAGNGLLLQKHHTHHSNSNNTSNASSTSPPPPLSSLNGHAGSVLQPSPTTAVPISPQDHHRALDELLNDMLLTVENIPDLPSSTTSPYGNRGFTTTTRHVATLDDLQPPHPFQHHHSPPSVATRDVISLPSASRTASACGNIPPGKQFKNGYGSDISTPGGGGAGDRTNVINTSTVLDDLVDVNYIDDTETEESIPYHARQDSRPFTYGAIPTSPQQQATTSGGQTSCSTMLQMHPGLASPSLVRKASLRGGSGTPKGSPVSSSTTLRQTSHVSPSQPSPPEDFVDGDLSGISPTRDYRYNNGTSSTSPRSPEFHDG